MGNRPMKRCSPLLMTREMQIKTAVGQHSHWSEQLSSRRTQINTGEDMEKGPSYTVGGNVN